jgi:hypothetical protein
MKKYFTILLIALVFIGCKPKETVAGTKLDNKSEAAIKGNWTISSVRYPGAEVIKLTSFGIADSKCFIGSDWKFVSNNNKGTMALNNASCTGYSSDITWYINRDGNVVMKFLNEGKARKVVDGYILKVQHQTENSFEFVDKADVGGKVVDVIYLFQRN